jgi:hypothetical protein
MVNNKIYIGAHKTKNKNDGYMGSGKILKHAIKKYGIENFAKEIIYEASSMEEMFDKEKEMVEIGKHSYNLKVGGFGGWDHINGKNHWTHSPNHIKLMNEKRLEKLKKEDYNKEFSLKVSEGLKEKIKNDPVYKRNLSERIKNMNRQFVLEKANSIESIQKRKNTFAKIEHQKGKNNSQFGSMWITNGVENKKIKKDSFIPEGWRKGRIMESKLDGI